MIELRAVVARAGMAPISTRLRAGEVVRVDGPAADVSALLDAIAGRRPVVAGEVVRRAPALVVRGGEPLPPGAERAAAALWTALARGAAPPDARALDHPPGAVVRSPDARALARGRTLRGAVWLVDGALADDAEAEVVAAAERVRAGDGAMLWTGGATRGQVDRVIELVAGAAPAAGGAATTTSPATARRAGGAAALARFAAAVATTRTALALGAVVALWLAACAVSVAAHEGFWYGEGSLEALAQLARLVTAGAVVTVALAASADAATTRAWPAMLRETRAPRWARAATLVVGDLAAATWPAALTAIAAAWAALLGDRGDGATIGIVLITAPIAAATTRRLPAGPLAAATGALVGTGVGLGLLW